jgi:HEAT repeat protein
MTRVSVCLVTALLLPANAWAQGASPLPPVPPVAPTPPAPRPMVVPAPRPAPIPKPAPSPDSADLWRFGPDVPIDMGNVDLQLDALNQQLKRLDVQVDVDVAPVIARAKAQADIAREQAREAMESFTFQGPFAVSVGGSEASAIYRGGLDALQQRQYDRAISSFDRVIAQKGERADAALYWKAFAQFKLARTEDALASIAQLRRDYAQSRYVGDAKVLEADVRKMAGQPVNPASVDDDEIKLLAIQGISKSDQAVPLLEGVLSATNSLNVKKRALYVLALSDDARAHPVLMRYAKGAGNPDLQVEAIRYLASRRDSSTTPVELRDIYDSTQDTNVKLAVIDAYRTFGDKGALIRISGERATTRDLRRSAISRLNGLADAQDVMSLYQQEADPVLRGQLVSVLGSMSAIDQLTTIAKTDKDQNVRTRAIRLLGSQRTDRATEILVGLYGSEQDKDVRRAVVQALGSQDNADALVSLARKETDPDLRRELVRRISELAQHSKVAADYLVEQLKK